MNMFVTVLSSFGLVAVGLCFLFFLPLVAKTLLILFSTVLGEQTFAKFNKVESGTKLIDPNELEEFKKSHA